MNLDEMVELVDNSVFKGQDVVIVGRTFGEPALYDVRTLNGITINSLQQHQLKRKEK